MSSYHEKAANSTSSKAGYELKLRDRSIKRVSHKRRKRLGQVIPVCRFYLEEVERIRSALVIEATTLRVYSRWR